MPKRQKIASSLRRSDDHAFLSEYRLVFDEVEQAITGIADRYRLRLFTQNFFIRLMLVAFVQNRGWLNGEGAEGAQDLAGLWQHYLRERGDSGANFYRDRLRPILRDEPFDKSVHALEEEADAVVPDAAIEAILCRLVARFHFTAVETRFFLTTTTPASEVLRNAGSDPGQSASLEYPIGRPRRTSSRPANGSDLCDKKITVDPEMLGTVFEEFVAGRHASGSYYTPRQIVSFMCREALKGYLRNQVPEESAQAIADLVDRHNAEGVADGPRVLASLQKVRVCDPACGCGAYLVGMMHELLDLRACLSGSSAKRNADRFSRKLEIIQNNLHGVDLDPFAVHITRMRLWLSLTVEHERPRTPSMANVKFQIWRGDSLGDGLTPSSPYPEERIKESGHIADNATISIAPHPGPRPRVPRGDEKEQSVLTEHRLGSARFDIVIMNPPYVATYSRESEKAAVENESLLKARYGHFAGRLNLFTCFIIQAGQMVSPGGAAVFIVPDSYATSDSYAKVREEYVRRFPDQTWALIKLGLFGANVRNVIVCCSAGPKSLRTATISTQADLDRLANHSAEYPLSVWGMNGRVNFFQSEFEQKIWVKLRRNTRVLSELFETRDGVNPGSRPTRERLLATAKKSAKIRPLIEGTQIDPRGYVIRSAIKTILYDPESVSAAERKAGTSLRDPRIFESPKIVSRQTADTLIAAIDLSDNLIALNSVHCTRSIHGNEDHLWGLLGLLNSPLARLFYAIDGGETRELLPQVHISWLRQFPLPERAEAMLEKIAALTRRAYETFGDEKQFADSCGRIYALICDAYGLHESESAGVLRAYISRYPRFSWASTKATNEGDASL